MPCFRIALSLAAGTTLSLVFLFNATVQAEPNVYALTSPGNVFGMFDLGSGTLTATGTLTGTADLARRPGGPLFGVEAAFNLLTIDPVTLAKTVVGFTGPDIDTLAFRDNGDLFGLSFQALFRLNSTTGSSTFIGSLGFAAAAGSASAQFNNAGQLFLSREEDGVSTLYGVNTTTGHAALIGSIGYRVTATHFTNDVLYGFTNDRLIILIDTSTGVGTPLISLGSTFRVVAFASMEQGSLHADFDNNLRVDASDLASWSSNFGATVTATHVQGDADGDHDVDGSDFLIWQQELGSVPTAATVPEPGCCSLILAAGLSLGIAGYAKRRTPAVRSHELVGAWDMPSTHRRDTFGSASGEPGQGSACRFCWPLITLTSNSVLHGPPAFGGRLVGYARVSTYDQDLSLKMDSLIGLGISDDDIFTDKAAGAKTERPGLGTCLAKLQPGDTLVVWRLDRLGRSMHHLVALIEELCNRDVGFRSVSDGLIDTTSPSGELIFHIFSALAQFERRLTQERTKAGLASARARGRLGGRPPIDLDEAKVRTARKLHDDHTLNIDDISRDLLILSKAAHVQAIPNRHDAVSVAPRKFQRS